MKSVSFDPSTVVIEKGLLEKKKYDVYCGGGLHKVTAVLRSHNNICRRDSSFQSLLMLYIRIFDMLAAKRACTACGTPR